VETLPGSERSDHAMMRRPVISWKRAANDNFVLLRGAVRRSPDRARRLIAARGRVVPFGRPKPVRIAARPLLIVGFSGLVLVALCGAFLIGLAAVGVLAPAMAGVELLRRQLRRKPPLGALDHQVVG
jgi:hypothetical protein